MDRPSDESSRVRMMGTMRYETWRVIERRRACNVLHIAEKNLRLPFSGEARIQILATVHVLIAVDV